MIEYREANEKIEGKVRFPVPHKHIEPYTKFVGWDGEGYTDPKTHRHFYTLFANSLGQYIVAEPGESLTTLAICEFIDKVGHECGPHTLHVIFYSSYDQNMIYRGNEPSAIIRDEQNNLNKHQWDILCEYLNGKKVVGPYTLSHIDLKFTEVRSDIKTTIYDLYTYYHSSFVKALDSVFGETWEGRDTVIRMKGERVDFDYSRLDEIIDYCMLELRNLARLAEDLYHKCMSVGIKTKKYYGPGAIANYLLSHYKVSDHMVNTYQKEPEVSRAAQYAYAGGRFELLKHGFFKTVYEYDLNQAYPYALSLLPSLKGGHWSHVKGDPGHHDFAMYHIKFTAPFESMLSGEPYPLFHRWKHGLVAYPDYTEGWYWTPEYDVTKEYTTIRPATVEIIEAWIFEPANDIKPFAFMHELHEYRNRLKAAGDGAQLCIKLGMNSVYGKTVQQVGGQRGKSPVPRFHQLEWGGYVTSWCRATIFRAAITDLPSIVGFETDAIFSINPLRLPESDNMGEFKSDLHRDLLYIQPGFYYSGDKQRTRGFRPKEISRSECERAIRKQTYPRVEITRTQFITGRMAFIRRVEWCTWIQDINKSLTLIPDITDPRCEDIKRQHVRLTCPTCIKHPTVYAKDSHLLQVVPSSPDMSDPYRIDWVDKAPDPKDFQIPGIDGEDFTDPLLSSQHDSVL